MEREVFPRAALSQAVLEGGESYPTEEHYRDQVDYPIEPTNRSASAQTRSSAATDPKNMSPSTATR